MVQVPYALAITVDPLTLQIFGVVEVNDTVSPEDAVALTLLLPPTNREFGAKLMELMLWAPFPIVMFCVVWLAAE